MRTAPLAVLAAWITGCCVLPAGVASGQVQAVTTARHDLRLAFTVPGRVQTVLVRPGDRVEKGQPIIVLDDRAGEAQIALYLARAESTLSIEAAQASLAQAVLEERAMSDAFTQNAAGKLELDRKRLEVKVQELRVEQAKDEREQAERQLEAARIAHDAYTLRAPMSGSIEEVVVAPGETVEPLKPVLRLVVTDPLWIDAYAPTGQTLGLSVGGPAWVVAGGEGTKAAVVQGKIVHIALVADARSDTRLVRVEVPNTGGAPAGGHVRVYFSRDEAERSVPAAASAGAPASNR